MKATTTSTRVAMAMLAACVAAADDSTQSQQDICRALVLSGGANNGAWEAGILWGLSQYSENPEDFYYDVTTGISAGAINAAGVAGFSRDQLTESAQFLSDTWANLTNKEIWQFWEGKGPIDGCLTEHGCLDDSYALEFLDETLKNFPEGYKRRVTVASGNVNTGEFQTFDQDDTAFSDMHQAALASGSIPGVFPPQLFKDMVLMDGGTVWDVNIISAVEQCLQVVDDVSKIVIDVAICGPGKEDAFDPGRDSATNWLHDWQLHRSYHGMNSIQWQQRAYPEADYRYLFYMQEPAKPWQLLDFRNQTTWSLQEQGRSQAKDTLEMGTNTGFTALNDWNADEKRMTEKWGSFASYLNSFLPSF